MGVESDDFFLIEKYYFNNLRKRKIIKKYFEKVKKKRLYKIKAQIN